MAASLESCTCLSLIILRSASLSLFLSVADGNLLLRLKFGCEEGYRKWKQSSLHLENFNCLNTFSHVLQLAWVSRICQPTTLMLTTLMCHEQFVAMFLLVSLFQFLQSVKFDCLPPSLQALRVYSMIVPALVFLSPIQASSATLQTALQTALTTALPDPNHCWLTQFFHCCLLSKG